MDIEVGSPWQMKEDVDFTCNVIEIDDFGVVRTDIPDRKTVGNKYDFAGGFFPKTFLIIFEPRVVKTDMVNEPPHYKDASGIECIEVTQHMRFCEGSSFYYVYQAGCKGSLIEDLKTAAWYAERSWKRNKCRNNRVHWLVQRKGEAIADSRDKQGQPFIAEVMRNIINNRYWQAYDSLMTEIERLESGEAEKNG